MKLSHEDQVLLYGSCPFPNERGLERLKRSLPAVKDWDALLAEASSRRVVSALAYNLECHGMDRFVGGYNRQILSAMRQVMSTMRSDMLAALRDLVGNVGQELRDLMVLKGFDLVHSAYPHSDLREMRDLDILIHREDIDLVRRTLLDAGFIQGNFDHCQQKLIPLPPAEIERAEGMHYECYPFRRLMPLAFLDGLSEVVSLPMFRNVVLIKDEMWHLLSVDLHHHLAPDIPLSDVWAGQRPLSINGMDVKGQSPEAMLWFIAARLYHEVMVFGERKLPLLHDIAAILHRWGEEMDWSKVLEVSLRHHLHPSLYYVLLREQQLFGVRVPTDVLAKLYPVAQGISRFHDWGDFLPKLLGYCEVSEITFTD